MSLRGSTFGNRLWEGEEVEYKVWIHIEEIDEQAKHYGEEVEPVCAGAFDTLAKAEALVKDIVVGVSTKPADEVLRACRNAEDTFRAFGESSGFGLTGPKCWAVIEELKRARTHFEQS